MAGPQPNFELMAQAFQGLATKVPKIFDALSACFNAVTTQNGHLTAQVDSLTTQVGALNDTVTAQGRRLDAFDNNNTHAVDQNQHIVDGSSPFHQLHDPVTNVPIPDFPGTCDAIEDLTSEDCAYKLSFKKITNQANSSTARHHPRDSSGSDRRTQAG
jgi:hypothetical protein